MKKLLPKCKLLRDISPNFTNSQNLILSVWCERDRPTSFAKINFMAITCKESTFYYWQLWDHKIARIYSPRTDPPHKRSYAHFILLFIRSAILHRWKMHYAQRYPKPCSNIYYWSSEVPYCIVQNALRPTLPETVQ